MTNQLKTLLRGARRLFGDSQTGYAQDILKGAEGFYKGAEAYNRGDYAAALREWRPLAEQGNEEAQTMLGSMYSEGLGVIQDYKEAVKWYRLAAEQGGASAQNNLGDMYRNGQGVIQDNVTAHMWFNIAASNGNEYAGLLRGLVAGQMTPSQLDEATKLARECVRKEYKGC